MAGPSSFIQAWDWHSKKTVDLWEKSLSYQLRIYAEEQTFRRGYKLELEQLYGDANIIAVIRASRMTWKEHLAHMQLYRPPLIQFRNDPEGWQEVSRPKVQWIDGVLQDLMNLKVRNWWSSCPALQDKQTWNSTIQQVWSHKWT